MAIELPAMRGGHCIKQKRDANGNMLIPCYRLSYKEVYCSYLNPPDGIKSLEDLLLPPVVVEEAEPPPPELLPDVAAAAAAAAAELLAAKAFIAACILCCGVIHNAPNCDREFKAFNEALFLSAAFLSREDDEEEELEPPPPAPPPPLPPPPIEPCGDIRFADDDDETLVGNEEFMPPVK